MPANRLSAESDGRNEGKAGGGDEVYAVSTAKVDLLAHYDI